MAFDLKSLFITKAVPDDAPAAAVAPTRALDLKNEAMKNAHALAKSENREMHLSDYFIAAMRMQGEAEALGVRWTPKEISDFSGMKLDGMTIRREDFHPDDATLNAMRSALEAKGVEGLSNSYDLDGNGTIEVEEVADFYKQVNASLNFSKTEFTNVTFRPASTLDIVQKAHGAQYGNVTLDGLGAGEVLTLGSGREKNADNPNGDRFYGVTLKNVAGGELRVNSHAILDNLKLDGADCTISVAAGGQINSLKAGPHDNLHLNVDPGGRITRVDLNGATLDAKSSLRGSEWHGGNIAFTDMRGVQFEGGSFSGINIHAPQLEGAHFKGTRFSNVQFSGIKADDFGALREALSTASSMHMLLVNGQMVKSLDDLSKIEQVTRAGETLSAAMFGNGQTAAAAVAAPASPVPAVAAAAGPAVRISGGENVTLSQQQAAGAPVVDTFEQRLALAEARAAKIVGDGVGMRP